MKEHPLEHVLDADGAARLNAWDRVPGCAGVQRGDRTQRFWSRAALADVARTEALRRWGWSGEIEDGPPHRDSNPMIEAA